MIRHIWHLKFYFLMHNQPLDGGNTNIIAQSDSTVGQVYDHLMEYLYVSADALRRLPVRI